MSKAFVIISTIILFDFSFCAQYCNLPKFCLNPTWIQNGTFYPSKNTDLHYPRSIFVDTNDIVYLSFDQNGIVIAWSKESDIPSKIYESDTLHTDSQAMSDFLSNLLKSLQKTPAKVFENFWNKISGGRPGSGSSSSDKTEVFVDIPNSLFVISNGDIYVGDGDSTRINKWTRNAERSVVSLNNYSPCYGLFVDNNDTLYCSAKDNHIVIKKSLKNNNSTWAVAAGIGSRGSTADMLNNSFGIFIDTSFNLYVADWGNNRIQLFKLGQTSGTTVVNNTIVFDSKPLNHPTDIVLDADSNLYIVDSYNRVLKFPLKTSLCDETTTGTTTTTISQTTTGTTTTTISQTTTETTKLNLTLASENTSSTALVSTSTTSSTRYSTIPDPNTISLGLTTTQSTTTNLKSITEVTSSVDAILPLVAFVPPNCSNSSCIGSSCNISMTLCDALKPCQNSGNCTNDPKFSHGYYCTCQPDFNGTNCESKVGPCKSNTCLYNGICIPLNSTNFQCNCTRGRTGAHCEVLIDYCRNVTCYNKAVCRPLPLDYKCECLSVSYSGRHCENIATSIIVRQYVSKAFGYIAIICLSIVAGFVVIMGILKYGFGIDPVRKERELIRRRRAALERRNRETQKPQRTLHLRPINKVSPEQVNPNTKHTITRKY